MKAQLPSAGTTHPIKTLTRAEFFNRQKDLGERRTAMLTCMTCSDTARRWGTWDDDPRLALQREIEWERGSAYSRSRNDRGGRLRDELTAINALIESHREEFVVLVNEIEQRRAWNERRPQCPRKKHGRTLAAYRSHVTLAALSFQLTRPEHSD
jgi:hypothetical protein